MHSDAPVAAATGWDQILRLYDQLLAVAPGPVVALNRAVAVAEVEGPAAALAIVDGLDLGGYYLFHAIRANLLRRLGRDTEAKAAYETAIDLTGNTAERAYLAAARDRPSRPDGLAEGAQVAEARSEQGLVQAAEEDPVRVEHVDQSGQPGSEPIDDETGRGPYPFRSTLTCPASIPRPELPV